MAENENSFFTANDIYVEVEGEAGKSLSLEEDQQNNLVGIVKSRYYNAFFPYTMRLPGPSISYFFFSLSPSLSFSLRAQLSSFRLLDVA